jgi:hypothetical protein
MTRRPAQVRRDVVDGHSVTTSRLYAFPRAMGAQYQTVTSYPGWLVEPTITRATGIAAALKAHADAVRALVLDADQAE